jgi:hypothetical protein
MGALSIAIVQDAARKDLSPHLTLRRINSKNCFEWVFSDGTTRSVQEVPVDKIRGLKLDAWLNYAKPLVGGPAVEGAPPVVLNAAEAAAPQGPAGGPNPSFMLLRVKEKPVPFDPDPEVQGYRDATRGFTACPYGLPDQIRKWNRGHDRAVAEGAAQKPRFGLTAGRRN